LPTWIRIRIPNADPDRADQNKCGFGSTTLVISHYFTVPLKAAKEKSNKSDQKSSLSLQQAEKQNNYAENNMFCATLVSRFLEKSARPPSSESPLK
jgi:hypothetical protein